MKKIFLLFLIISRIIAQQNIFEIFDIQDLSKNKNKDKTNLNILNLEKSTNSYGASNNNPQLYISGNDTIYEDSLYINNIFTDDRDFNEVSVSVTSKPNWLGEIIWMIQ